MPGNKKVQKIRLPEVYTEETVKVPVLITLVVLLLIATPLIFWIITINKEGIRAADVSRYTTLVQNVSGDLRTVDAMVNNDADELALINASRKTPSVTLIVPEIVLVDEQKDKPKDAPELRAELEGIYWSPDNPLVGIGGETYRVGDTIQGFEIVRIGKTTVQFQAQDGSIVVKDMYGNLLQNQR